MCKLRKGRADEETKRFARLLCRWFSAYRSVPAESSLAPLKLQKKKPYSDGKQAQEI
jgi:hypothetical protein